MSNTTRDDDAVDFLAVLEDKELAIIEFLVTEGPDRYTELLTQARPDDDRRPGPAARQRGNDEADRRFGKKGA